ncbi:MAG: membrane protein insertase YidC [Proteobacteria bacterium]|nr:membrane protein insertase YidC [Pseudomonadota bacterium]
MDLQRSLLIGAIAVLSFMLLTEWVAFKEERAPTPQTSSRITSNFPQGNSELPVTPTSDSSPVAGDDIPVAVTIPGEDTTETPVLSETNNHSSFIQVQTGTLQVAIDLHGGDIAELALSKHLEKLDNPDQPFILLEQNNQRIYIAQSGLIGPNGIDKGERASYTSNANSYTLSDGEESLQVDLNWSNSDGLSIVKRFTFRRDSYLVDVDFLVSNNSSERFQANLFGQIKRDSSTDPAANSSGMGMVPFLGAAVTQPDDRFTKFSFEDMEEEPFKAQLPGGWVAMIQHYFLSAWIPNPDQTHNYSTRVTGSGFNIAGFTSPALTLDPGEQGSTGARFYAGPKDQYVLRDISPYLELSVDYGWLWWIAQPIFWLLTQIQAVVINWGVAIILLTVLIKGAFFKLSAKSYQSMANMRRVQPKMADIRELYADDKQKQSQAMMELYKKEKINPMGGCLPILVQMPVFISLYWVLMEAVDLRHAPFFLWIHDLSVMDPYFVLPLMMGASMWFMQKLNPPPPDPMQAKIMQWMPVMFTFFFLWFPAGLVLYWVVNNLLSMAQQYVITKRIEAAG